MKATSTIIFNKREFVVLLAVVTVDENVFVVVVVVVVVVVFFLFFSSKTSVNARKRINYRAACQERYPTRKERRERERNEDGVTLSLFLSRFLSSLQTILTYVTLPVSFSWQ